jgi:transformation/transcription domain-associated protein
MGMLLEQLGLDSSLTPQLKTKKDSPVDCYEFEPSTSPPTGSPTTTTAQQQEALDSLLELYSSLKEEDLWAGLWQRKAKYPETNVGIAFELQGYYEKAQGCFEVAMNKAKNETSVTSSSFSEYKLWEDHWVK